MNATDDILMPEDLLLIHALHLCASFTFFLEWFFHHRFRPNMPLAVVGLNLWPKTHGSKSISWPSCHCSAGISILLKRSEMGSPIV